MQISLYAVILAVWLNCALAQAPKPRPPIVFQDNGFIMVMNSAKVSLRSTENKEIVHTASFTTANVTVDNRHTELTTVITFPNVNSTSSPKLTITDFVLTLKFLNDQDYWTLVNASVTLKGSDDKSPFNFNNAHLLSTIGLYAPIKWSFHCSQFGPLYPSEIDKANHTVNIAGISLEGFQIQPFTLDPSRFAEAYECVGFFSIGILSGIFVTLMLMAILAWGLAMIMDVKTMDRFDDPKGKPISFGGTE